MSNLTVVLFSVCLAAIYCLSEAEDNCPAPPPADAIYYRATRNCTGVRIIKGKRCCCRCNGVPDARGFYCNQEAYCLMGVMGASNSTTAAATTSASGSTTSSASTTSSGSTSAASTSSTASTTTTSTTSSSST